MGYTHYWRREREIPAETMGRLVPDFGKLVLSLHDNGILLGDGLGKGAPTITDDEICFNGLEACQHPANAEITLPWPSKNAGGIGSNRGVVDGSSSAGVTIETRCCNGDCSYETFALPRLRRQTPEAGCCVESCKTAFRPYDIAVTACLLIPKHHLDNRIEVTTDGEDGHWWDAKMLCQMVLSYGLEYAIVNSVLLPVEGEPMYTPPPQPKRILQPVRRTR